MAEENFANGEESAMKIEALQRDNADKSEEIKKLRMEIGSLRSDAVELRERLQEMEREVELSREAEKAAKAIAARAAQLEGEVSRLQHDSLTEMNAAEEARIEAAQLRKVLDEKKSRVEHLERELDGLKKVKGDNEIKLRDLERKIGALEMKEIEERNKKIRAEEEMRDKLDEKEREIGGVRKKIQELQEVVDRTKSELEEKAKEKFHLEEALTESVEKVRTLESKVSQLLEEAGEADKLIRSLNDIDNPLQTVNGIHAAQVKDFKLHWPVVAAGSTGAVVAAVAVIYVCFGRRR